MMPLRIPALPPRTPKACRSRERRAKPAPVPGSPTEAQFQRQVIQLAQLLGYRVAHFRTSMNARGGYQTAVAGDGKGFPDLVLVGKGRILFAELKVGKNRMTAEQRAWADALVNAGQEFYEWRPENWNDIRDLLTGDGP